VEVSSFQLSVEKGLHAGGKPLVRRGVLGIEKNEKKGRISRFGYSLCLNKKK